MRLLSVLCTNAYPGTEHVEFMLRNLAQQTFHDFELVLVDMFYDDNAQIVSELSEILGLRSVLHTPACEARHVGRWLHWELYSNALLLSHGKFVLHHGMNRYLHRSALEVVASCAEHNTNLVLAQRNVEESLSSLAFYVDPEVQFAMSTSISSWPYLSQSGFFSINTDTMIHDLNGHNEALLIHHWVDNDLGARSEHLAGSMRCRIMQNGLLRLNKSRSGGYSQVLVGKPVCSREDNPQCVAWLIDALQEYRVIGGSVERINHKGYSWVRCGVCGTIGVEDSSAYVARLSENSGLVKAPVNVAGVGRNIEILADDLRGKSTADKVSTLIESHTNPRYLQA